MAALHTLAILPSVASSNGNGNGSLSSFVPSTQSPLAPILPDRRRRRSLSPSALHALDNDLDAYSHAMGTHNGATSPLAKRFRGDNHTNVAAAAAVVTTTTNDDTATATNTVSSTETIVTSLRSLSVSTTSAPATAASEQNGDHHNNSSSSSSSSSNGGIADLQCGLCHQILCDAVQLTTCGHSFCRTCLVAYTARSSSSTAAASLASLPHLPAAASVASPSASSPSSTPVASSGSSFPFSLFAVPFKKLQTALSPSRRRSLSSGNLPASPSSSSSSSSPSASSSSSSSSSSDTRLCGVCRVPFHHEQVSSLATSSPLLHKRLHDYLANTRDLHIQVATLAKQLHDVTAQLASVREVADFAMPRPVLCTLHAHAVTFTTKLTPAQPCAVMSCGALVSRALHCADCSFVICRGCFGKFRIDEGDEIGLRDGVDENVYRASVVKVDGARARVLLQVIGRSVPPFWLDCNSPRIQG